MAEIREAQPESVSSGESAPMSLAEFLESIPPNQLVEISPLARRKDYQISTPEIQLHCSESSCNGNRFFRYIRENAPELSRDSPILIHLHYCCSNCQKGIKVFSLWAKLTQGDDGQCYKIGELPAFGPPTPSRLISLIGPDRDLFLKGRRCENQGLGIGAFVYYRRVIENQKNRILSEIVKVSQKIGVDQAIIQKLENAINENQFSKAIGNVKDAIPQTLLINGHNPMTLLPSALSDGLHAQTDERCLEIAQAVRVVLVELAERLAQALKDEAELNNALSRLIRKA